ncbi:MAG TPA: N-acetyl-alpha-D-glucosaminyl L-malate synthase BshA [Candidatus Limnocylindrales bacterium]|nr:N-acetyl-alpha-D-glucosaminyl L-malate synthase BshA [Candidatus Limnocylindrales bacterium]
MSASSVSASLAVGIVCYPTLGGSSVIASDLAVGLAGAGHRVHVIASAPPSRPLPESDRLFFHEVAVSTTPLFENPPYAMAVAATILGVCSEHELDLVHVHYAVPHATSAYLARQVLAAGNGAKRPRMICTLHGTDVTRTDGDPAYRDLTRFAVATCDGVTVPSQFLREAAYQRLGLPRHLEVEVIANFVDTEHFTPATQRDRTRLEDLFAAAAGPQCEHDGPVLFHVSNFRPVKRTGDLFEVLARVRKHVPARLVLVGDGPERSHAAQRARELGLTRAVCFLGKRGDFVEHLRHADAFVLPSQSESFGVAALEAMSAGVPVFGYRVGGLPEVVGEDAGTLVEPFDVDALAAAVVAVLQDPQRRGAMGSAARARAVERFRCETALERYVAYYRRILASGRSKA